MKSQEFKRMIIRKSNKLKEDTNEQLKEITKTTQNMEEQFNIDIMNNKIEILEIKN
jgi:hypothetical protein